MISIEGWKLHFTEKMSEQEKYKLKQDLKKNP